MTYTPGEIVFVEFPHSSGKATVKRPALVVIDTGDQDVVVARITTQAHATNHDVVIAEWKSAGLLAPSVARLHKLATVEKRLILRSFGQLEPVDHSAVSQILKQTFSNW